MRNLWKLALMAIIVAAICTPAQAISLQNGFTTAKIADWSSLYRAPSVRPGQTQDPVPWAGGFVPTFPGDDNRTIFNVSTIPDIPPFDFVSSGTVGTGAQLKGMLYDLTPIAGGAAPGPNLVFYGALGRNPISGAPAGTGGALEIYLDEPTSILFSPTAANALGAGPNAWDEADSLGLASGGVHSYIGRDTFPTINQEGQQLWLQLVLIPLPGAGIAGSGVPAGALMKENVNIGGSEAGDGEAYAMVVGGSFAPYVSSGGLNADYLSSGYALPAGLNADLHILFDIDPNPPTGTQGWGIRSQDPVTFVVVPEPLTMTGVLFGIGMLGTYVRKRRK